MGDNGYEQIFTDKTKERLVFGAIKWFKSEDFLLLAGLSMKQVSEAAGVPLRTARRHFSIASLRGAVVRQIVCGERERPEPHFSTGMSQLESASDQSIKDLTSLLVDELFTRNFTDANFMARTMLLAQSYRDTQIASMFAEREEARLHAILSSIYHLLVASGRAPTSKENWISAYDLALTLMILVDGFAMRCVISRPPTGDSASFEVVERLAEDHTQLVARIVSTAIESMLEEEPSMD